MADDNHVSLEMENTTTAASVSRQRNDRSAGRTSANTSARVPRAVSELDEDDQDERPFDPNVRPGIDDGLLGPGQNGTRTNIGGETDDRRNGGVPRERRPSFSFPGYNGTGFVNIDGVETPIPDVNAYQHKKTLAQGMMDLALLSANANQLRYVLETYRRHPFFYPSLIFISLSIIFQVAVGVGLILNSRYNIKDEREGCKANKVNNRTVVGIFIITVINVLISAFGVAEPVQAT